jgi:hypothetical protein
MSVFWRTGNGVESEVIFDREWTRIDTNAAVLFGPASAGLDRCQSVFIRGKV